jgi:hypothetical protein
VAAFCFLAGFALLATGIAVADRTTRVDRAAAGATGAPAAEVTAAQWRATAVGALFPAEITLPDARYVRQGIAPQRACDALPGALLAQFDDLACVAVLQATYVDQTRTVVATVGVVVLGGSGALRAVFANGWSSAGATRESAWMPHALPVAGTPAAGFTDATRTTWNSQVDGEGSYLCYAVSGFADGRLGPDAAARTTGANSALAATSPTVTAVDGLPGVLVDELSTTAGSTP